MIKIFDDPYDQNFSICKKKEIEIQPGITILTGCNGIGKSTILHNIKNVLEKENIPVFFYDNQKGNKFINNDANFMASLLTYSEGEKISLNLKRIMPELIYFIKNGKLNNNYINLLGFMSPKNNDNITNERWILFDAIDSGYSIDNIIEIKNLFKLMINDANDLNKKLYIVSSSNEYELTCDMNCFDIIEGEYIKFKDYEDYKNFILNTRNKKDKRY